MSGERNVDDAAPAADGIPGAIQQECRRSKEAAAEVEEGNVLIGRALFAARLKDLLLRIIVDGRVQLDEIEHVTEIERQLRHLLGGNFSADVGIVHLQQRSRVRHFDLFSRPYRQSDCLTCRLADLQRDGLHLEGSETCRLHGQRVGTGRQKREGEIAFFVGLEGARNALFRVGQSDSGIRYTRPRWIGDGTR